GLGDDRLHVLLRDGDPLAHRVGRDDVEVGERAQGLDGRGARDLAGLVPAHAVGDEEDGARDEEAVLVEQAPRAPVRRRAPGEVDLGGLVARHEAPGCTTMRRSPTWMVAPTGTRTRAPGSATRGGAPGTETTVPLVEPRSVSHRPLGSTRSSACVLETERVGSSTATRFHGPSSGACGLRPRSVGRSTGRRSPDSSSMTTATSGAGSIARTSRAVRRVLSHSASSGSAMGAAGAAVGGTTAGAGVAGAGAGAEGAEGAPPPTPGTPVMRPPEAGAGVEGKAQGSLSGADGAAGAGPGTGVAGAGAGCAGAGGAKAAGADGGGVAGAGPAGAAGAYGAGAG